MWRETIEARGDETRHDRFVQHCFRTGRLAAAAARYAAHLAGHPDDETARRMQQRVVFLSTQVVVPSPQPRGKSRLLESPWFVAIVLAGAVAGAILGIVYGARR